MHEATERFRLQYRREEIGRHYRGWGHFAFTTGATGAVVVACAVLLENVQAWEWLGVPLFFLLANLVEHFGHRNPMHRPIRGLGLLFKRHSGQHHRFFTHERMSLSNSRDFKVVLFPPVMFAFFFGAIACPIGLLLAFAATPNLAYLFVLTSVGYFLNYELLHLAYHLPESSRFYAIPGLRALRRHHLNHHNPALMARYNFNITYPIGDWLHGTWYSNEREGSRLAGRSPGAGRSARIAETRSASRRRNRVI